MLVTTRERYALLVMIDLAEHNDGKCIPIRDIARRQELSPKYLEQILPLLSKNNLVYGVHGKNGGYRIIRQPEKYKVVEILRVAEGNLAPVSCLNDDSICKKESRPMKMWSDFYKLTNDYFDSITIADLMENGSEYDYVI